MDVNNKILIVDDQEDLRNQLAKLLVRAGKQSKNVSLINKMKARLTGQDSSDIVDEDSEDPTYIVEVAAQGETAFQMIKKANEKEEPYAMMFLDMRMPPGWDGLKTAKEIRSIDKKVEIVIMTAYADHDQSVIAKEIGIPHKLLYIKKPFQTEEIYQLALSLTSKWSFEERELRRKNDLELLIRNMCKIKTLSIQEPNEIYSVILDALLKFTGTFKGFIVEQNEDKWKLLSKNELEQDHVDEFLKKNSNNLKESLTTRSLEGKYILPLRRNNYIAFIVLYDLQTKKDPEWYSLLNILTMTSGEILSGVNKKSNKDNIEKIIEIATKVRNVIKDEKLIDSMDNIINKVNKLKEE